MESGRLYRVDGENGQGKSGRCKGGRHLGYLEGGCSQIMEKRGRKGTEEHFRFPYSSEELQKTPRR